LHPREEIEPFLARGRIARIVQIDQRRIEVRFRDRRENRRW
jgi:hypothetical protein